MTCEGLLVDDEFKQSTKSISVYSYIQKDGPGYIGTYDKLVELTGHTKSYIMHLNYHPRQNKRVIKIGELKPVIAIYNKEGYLETVGNVKELPYEQYNIIKMIKARKREGSKRKAYVIDYDLELLTTPIKEE